MNMSEDKKNQKVDEFAEMQNFVNNPARRKEAIELANRIKDKVGKNWFTELRLMRKSGQSLDVVHRQLQALRMFNLIQVKTGSFKDGKDTIDKLIWKISIDSKSNIRIINEKIGLLQDEINQLINERKRFEAQLPEQESVEN